MRQFLLRSIAIFCVQLVWLCSASAEEPWEWERDESPRVGLVVGAVADSDQARVLWAIDELNQTDLTLVRWQPTRSEGERAKIHEVEELAARARHLYFFEGSQPAQAFLETVIPEFLEVSQLWMRDGDAADALFEGTIFLIRAYLDQGEEERATETMAELVRALPAHEPDERVIPPAVVDLWARARDGLSRERARLDLSEIEEGGECHVELNGWALDSSMIIVAANRTYLVASRCGEQLLNLRWISAGNGEIRRLSELNGNFDIDGFVAASTNWGRRYRLESVIYLGPGNCGGTQQQLCMAVSLNGRVLMQPFEDSLFGQSLSELRR